MTAFLYVSTFFIFCLYIIKSRTAHTLWRIQDLYVKTQIQMQPQSHLQPGEKYKSSWCTICLYCCQRLLLSRNNLFTFGEHFQTKQFLIKHWRNTIKDKLQRFPECESDFVEAFISSPKRFIFPSTRPIWSLSLSKWLSFVNFRNF